MRMLPTSLLLLLLAVPSFGQSVGDTSIVQRTLVRDRPSVNGDVAFSVEKGDRVFVQKKDGQYYRVQHDKGTGWILDSEFMGEEAAAEYRARQKAKREKARERRKYLQGLREKGYTIVLSRQTFRKNSADGISIGLGLVNISRSKTIKYVKVTWKLFNSVGDPIPGKNAGSATKQTRLVGPLEPEESGYTEFENVWYSPVATCAEIRKIEVEHIDGSSFIYINDLKDVAGEAETVRLKGDCSYKAQQKRN